MSPLLMAGRIPGGRSGTHQPGDGAGRLGPCHRRTRASAASLAYSLSPYTPRGYRKDSRGRPGREGPTGPRNKVRWPLPHTRVGHLRWGVAGDQVRSTGGGPDDERLRHRRLGLVVDDPGHARLLGAGRRGCGRPAAAPRQPDQQRQPGQPPRPGAEEILAERLVRGEIDPDEYRQRLQTLQETTSRT